MKKLLLSLSIACLGLAAQAQDFKPAKGDVTTEFGLAGGLNNAEFDLNEGLLRFRYFVKSDLAIRAGFNVSTFSNTDNIYGVVGSPNENKVGYNKDSETTLMINLGVEKHFAGTDRLSPYVGADFLIGSTSEKESRENTLGGNYVENEHFERKAPGSFGFGLRGVIGADYYIAKRLYLGAEAGFGFMSSKDGEVTTTTTTGGNTTTVTNKSAGKNFGISSSIITAVRVGFVF